MEELHDRLNTLADEARSAAEKSAEEGRDERDSAVVELHQIGRKRREMVKDAAATTAPNLRLME